MEFSDTLTLKEIIVGPMSRTKLKELDQIISPNIKGVEIIKARHGIRIGCCFTM